MREKSDFVAAPFVTYKNGRVFIDICKSGCGSACKYCYSPSHFDVQKLLSIEEIKLICNFIIEKYSKKIDIISLCPNTEPLKTHNSMQLIFYIINFFINYNCKIQISTKEIIPLSFLEQLNKISKKNIYINIS